MIDINITFVIPVQSMIQNENVNNFISLDSDQCTSPREVP